MSNALRYPYENVERRVLGCLPVYRTRKEQRVAMRLEAEGHSAAEIAAIKRTITNKADPREGTANDPRIIGLMPDGSMMNPVRPVVAVSAEHVYGLLAGDEHFVADLVARQIRTGVAAEPVGVALIVAELEKLERRGYAEREQERWSMTKDGLDAITAHQEGM